MAELQVVLLVYIKSKCLLSIEIQIYKQGSCLALKCTTTRCLSTPQGSWKESLRTAFKNFHRDRPGDEENKPPSTSTQGCQQPPSKRLRQEPNEQAKDGGDITEEDYQQAVASRKSEWKKGKHKRDHAVIKELMEKTFTRRRQWITGEKSPLVCEVVEEFPCLRSTKVVSVIFFFLCV